MEHAAGITVITILDYGDIDIKDIASLEHFISRDAMADLVVDGGADRLRVGRMAMRRIIKRGGDGFLHIDHIVVAQLVQLACGDARLDMGRDKIQHFRSQFAGYAHFFDIFFCLDVDCHGIAGLAPRFSLSSYSRLW